MFFWFAYFLFKFRSHSQNDDIMYEIYNIYFYNLKISQQRIVLFMLAKSQRPYMIRLLGVMPLAVNTALLVSDRCVFTVQLKQYNIYFTDYQKHL